MAKRKVVDEYGQVYVEKKRGGCLKNLGMGLILFIAFGVIGNALEEDGNKSTASTDANVTSVEADNNSIPESEISTIVVEKIMENDIPQEYKNALKKAESYSGFMSMSKQGVYDQLVSDYGEGFPVDAAQYAIDNVSADWNKNALEKAKSYYDKMAMSKSAVYDQLISEYGEQFTTEEAQYAVDNLE